MRLGIDFGTTRTVVAVADRGNFPIVSFEGADGDQHPYVPSLAATCGDELVFGHAAAAALQQNPDCTAARSFKRDLADARQTPSRAPELLAGFLTALKTQLLEHSDLPVVPADDEPLQAVVAVPANATSTQRFETLEAFRVAGFEVIGLLNEPSAAAIEYAHRYRKTLTRNREHVLVYDLGGGTFDLSLLQLADGAHAVIRHGGVTDLGGDDFDAVLLELALREAGWDEVAEPQRTRLLEVCRHAKEGLHPNSRRVTVDLDADTSVSMPTATYYAACKPLVQRSIEVIGTVLRPGEHEAFDTRDIAGVYVVGGGSELPIVARQLKEVFGRRVRRSAYSSAATAVGLAIAASGQAPVLLERFGRTFGVFRELYDGTDVAFDAIFDRETPVSVRGQVWVRRYRPVHNIGHFRFAECARVDASGTPEGDLIPAAELWFPFDPELRDREQWDDVVVERPGRTLPVVEEAYEVDATGVVRVKITDVESGFSRAHRL